MNKYELALVVSAKIEDDARAAVVAKAQEYVTRAGGVVSEVEEWGKKKLAYEIQKQSEGFYYFIQFEAMVMHQLSSNSAYVSWKMFFVSYALEKTRHRIRGEKL